MWHIHNTALLYQLSPDSPRMGQIYIPEPALIFMFQRSLLIIVTIHLWTRRPLYLLNNAVINKLDQPVVSVVLNTVCWVVKLFKTDFHWHELYYFFLTFFLLSPLVPLFLSRKQLDGFFQYDLSFFLILNATLPDLGYLYVCYAPELLCCSAYA